MTYNGETATTYFEMIGRKYTHEQWLIALGDNPWGLMDLTDAKEETILASDLLHVYDQLPGGLLLTHPRASVYDGDYDVVELDDIL